MSSKAYFVHVVDEPGGYAVHALTPGQAKAIAFFQDPGYTDSFLDWRCKREPDLDDIPITIDNLINIAGWDMIYEGEPITELDIKCPCPLCKEKTR